MQCAACRTVFPDDITICPRCNTPKARARSSAPTSPERAITQAAQHETQVADRPKEAGTVADAAPPAASTLIEFPGTKPRPQWRKELSERVREIQQRRALEAAREAEEAARRQAEQPPDELEAEADPDTVSPLGLVPPAAAAALNPLVANALKRIERARRQQASTPPITRARGGRGATAAARLPEETYQEAVEETPHIESVAAPQPVAETRPAPLAQAARPERVARETPAEAPGDVKVTRRAEPPQRVEAARPAEVPRPAPLSAVQAAPPTKIEPAAAPPTAQARPRRHIPEVIDESYLARREAEAVAAERRRSSPDKDDYAPFARRAAGGLIDLLVVAFGSTPFAAVIELTNGNWHDARVAASMAGVVCLIMFLYLTASTALAGRTWGMRLVSLQTVDVSTGLVPTTGQCARRAAGYIISLAAGGLGLLYALLDAEGRALHDHLSRTVVVSE